MAKSNSLIGLIYYKPLKPRKRTSIGNSSSTRPLNKQKRRSFKKYKGQGK